MAGAWPGAQHMGPLPGFLSPSQSACVKGRNPEKVLESWAAATSTVLLLLSAFLSICKDFYQGQTDLSALHCVLFLLNFLPPQWASASCSSLCPPLACQRQGQSTAPSQTWEALALGTEMVSGNSYRGTCALVQVGSSHQPPSCQNNGEPQ